MAIEPLASIMTVQAQGAVPARQVVSTETHSQEGSSALVQEAARTDKTISVVDNAKNKGQSAFGGSEDKQAKEQVGNEQIRKAVEKLNKNMHNSEAIFGFHESTNRVMIKIVDKETKEVIKELPPEKTLDMIAKLWELAGILVDEKR